MRLNAADDATLAIMEARPKEFPGSDARAVVTALTQALARAGPSAAKELSRLCAVEDAKLGGGGAMVLNRAAFLNVMCELCAHAPGLGEFVDAQRLITLWRVLPKVSFDPSQTRLPAGVRGRRSERITRSSRTCSRRSRPFRAVTRHAGVRARGAGCNITLTSPEIKTPRRQGGVSRIGSST